MEKSLQDRIGYHYKNEKLLAVALTHSSYANESKGKIVSNERLEFLCDAFLSIITADYLFHNFPDLPEGELTKWRASLVCEKALCGFARELGLGGELRLGKGEQHSGGAQRPSILADAFEAVIASIYLDGGMDAAKKFVLRFIGRDIHSKKLHVFKDYKTMLQEIIQQNPEERLEYVLVGESGPDHDKHFVAEVRLNSNVLSKGGGRSKKEAEQEAARLALELMGY